MTRTATKQSAWIESFSRMTGERNDPAWLYAARRDALERFLAAGLPGSRDESWLYSNVRVLAKHEFKRARSVATPAAATLEGNILDMAAGPRLVFVNGRFDAALSDISALPTGVQLASLDDAIASDPDALRAILGPSETACGQPLADLNMALFEDGAFLSVAPNTAVDLPVQIVFVMTPWQDDVVEHPRLIVSVGENAALHMLERYEAQGPGARLTNAVTSIDIAAGAHVGHVRLQREDRSAMHVGFTEVTQHRDSHYDATAVSLGGVLCRQETHVDLRGEGAHASLSGLSVIGGHEHVDNYSVIHHRVPDCTSREMFKNIVGGHARGAFTGRVVVAPDAQRTSATQANDNLLLSTDAVVETRPQLEIYADDVKCAHGATIGQLDEEQAFYLRSRGLGPLAARNLLIHGFAREVLDGVRDAQLRSGLEQVLASRLNVDVS